MGLNYVTNIYDSEQVDPITEISKYLKGFGHGALHFEVF